VTGAWKHRYPDKVFHVARSQAIWKHRGGGDTPPIDPNVGGPRKVRRITQEFCDEAPSVPPD
jgi:hypothetical protein